MGENQYSGVGTNLRVFEIILIEERRSAGSKVHISEPKQFDLWNLSWSCVFSFSTKYIESSWLLNVLAPEVV